MGDAQWTPLFTDGQAEPYRKAIDAVTAALDQQDVRGNEWGRPLLHAYLAVAQSDAAHRQRAIDLLDGAAEALETEVFRPALYYGIAGVGWLIAHVLGLLGRHEEEIFEALDGALIGYVKQQRLGLDYDLISGTAGLGVYFLERVPDDRAVEGLAAVVDWLHTTAEFPSSETATWFTGPNLMPEWQREIAPSGYYNVGVAHGVPGVVGLLAAIGRAGLLDARGRTLLVRATRWVLDQVDADDRVPHWVGHRLEDGSTRLSWCYGELGACVALLAASVALDDTDIGRRALGIARTACKNEPDPGTHDACLCHGAAGNAHVFNRLFQATGEREFERAARVWYAQALSLRHADGSLGGFRGWQPDMADPQGTPWRDDPSFLAGASGVALALLGGISAIEPRWDRPLLTSLDVASAVERPQVDGLRALT